MGGGLSRPWLLLRGCRRHGPCLLRGAPHDPERNCHHQHTHPSVQRNRSSHDPTCLSGRWCRNGCPRWRLTAGCASLRCHRRRESVHRSGPCTVLVGAATAVLANVGCAYDFDAPFGGAAAGTGGAAGFCLTEQCDDRIDNDIGKLVDRAGSDCAAIAKCVGTGAFGVDGAVLASYAGLERPVSGGSTLWGGGSEYASEFVGDRLDFVAPRTVMSLARSGLGTGVAGACEPGDVTFGTLPPFERVLHLCPASVAMAGCSAGTPCVATPGQGWSEYLCIRRAGVEVCPSSWPTPFDAYGRGVDLRGCTPCDWHTLQVAPVRALDVYHLARAEGCVVVGPFPSFAGGNCVSYDLPVSFLERWSFLREPGSLRSEGACLPAGGQPVGTVRVEESVTIGCIPVL